MMQILQHIPLWVFALFMGLIALGWMQSRTRHMRAHRLLGFTSVMTLFTLVGVIQLWLDTPWLLWGLASWAGSCLLMSQVIHRRPLPIDAAYDAEDGRFTVPGSWVPLALFMTIFICKFTVGFLKATEPSVLQNMGSAIGISALYGLFSGLLNGRAWRLLRLRNTRQPLPMG